MVSLKELRKQASSELEALESDSPLADVDYILIHMLGFSKSQLILGNDTVEGEKLATFNCALERLKKGEPVQYIAGGCEFMSLWFEVDSSTLVPRADTEILVEAVVERCSKLENSRIFEIGSGSGCIAVSLAHFLPHSEVLSVDISEDALNVAKRNAKRHNTENRCRFERLDIMKDLPDFRDLPTVVVSNPPYIPKADISELEKKVQCFEPMNALDGGEDGLDFYRRISADVPLVKGGILAFEVGIGQANSVCELMKKRFHSISIIPDLSGIDRVVIGYLK